MVTNLSQGKVCDGEESVGYELVKSYFTLLTNAPEHVWRFYGKDSRYRYVDVMGAAVVASGQDQIKDAISRQAFGQCTVKIDSADVLRVSDHQCLVEVVGDAYRPYRGPCRRSFVQSFLIEYSRTGRFYIRASTLRYGQVIADSKQTIVPPQPSDPEPNDSAVENPESGDYHKPPANEPAESGNTPVVMEDMSANQLFVGHIRKDTTTDHLWETFRAFGIIASVQILNGRSKSGNPTKFNYAFVRFKYSSAVEAILAKRSYQLNNGNEVTVNRSKLYPGNFGSK